MSRSYQSYPLALVLAVGLCVPVACTSIAGVSDFSVDNCFDGCGDATGTDGNLPEGSTPDGSTPEGSTPDGPAPDAPPPPSPGQSTLVLSGTGVAVGKTIVATLTILDDAGVAAPRDGSKVTFAFTGGTSVLTAATATNAGNGTYRALLTGVTEGTKVSVIASLDGAALKTTPPEVRVANPVATNLTFMLDAANVDNLGNAGSKTCPGAGPTTWKDLGGSHFTGTLLSFADPCGAAAGWAGAGTPEDPFRLSFDGIDNTVDFGAVNGIVKVPATQTQQTILAWVRKTGAGTAGSSGLGTVPGLASTYPIFDKGTADNEADATDINYYLSVTDTGFVGVDYEITGSDVARAHDNVPLIGTTPIADGTWYFMGYTLDIAAASRIVYVNGAVDTTSAPTGGPSSGVNEHLIVGGATQIAGTARGRFKGDVAVVLTYDRALSPAEIQKNCHSFSSRFGMKSCPN